MNATDVLLGAMAVIVALLLAWGSTPVGRWVLFGSGLLVAVLLFLPGGQITGLIGNDAVAALRRAAARTPWDVSDWTHFVIFVWLGLVVWLGRADLRGMKACGLVLGLAAAAELAQGWAPGREPRADDLVLNLAGGAVGLALGVLACWLSRKGR